VYIHYIMELCTGGDLVDHLVQAGQYSERDAAQVVAGICEAVAYMHDMGVMHRDIKLENFLYDKVSSVTCASSGRHHPDLAAKVSVSGHMVGKDRAASVEGLS
jgi:serine/threonine protein kinase